MDQTDTKVINAKSRNAKLFPFYKMFAWDLLFYYSIQFLFYTQNKGLHASEVLFAEAFYPIFKLLFQIPCVNIVEILSKRRSIIVGNILVTLGIIELIVGQGIASVILFNILIAIGYSIKNICESPLLNDCVSYKENSRTVFSNLDGKGSSFWYYFDAITGSCCGFLYVFNNYLPIYLCLASSVISLILSLKFVPYEDESKRTVLLNETSSFKAYFKDIKISFKNIFQSSRLKSLLIFSAGFSGLLMVRTTMASSLFTEIGIKEEYFGIIFAILTGISGIASKNQNFFHKRLKNKLLSYFSLTFCISMIVVGLSAIITHGSMFGIIIILLSYALQYMIKGPYYTLQKRYLNSFSSSTMVPKIYSATTLIESIFSSIVYFIASFLLTITDTSYALVILGCIFTIIFIFILDYMKPRLGLKPEEYKKSDINFTEVH